MRRGGSASSRCAVQAIMAAASTSRAASERSGACWRRCETGYNVALTADVPKVARVAGTGIVMLGRRSGRPIYPAAMATSRRIMLNNWDRSAVNLPFGRIAIVARRAGRGADATPTKPPWKNAAPRSNSGFRRRPRRAYAIVDRKVRHADRG